MSQSEAVSASLSRASDQRRPRETQNGSPAGGPVKPQPTRSRASSAGAANLVRRLVGQAGQSAKICLCDGGGGSALLLIPMLATAGAIWFTPDQPCPIPQGTPPAADAIVHTAQHQVHVNGQLCAGVKFIEFFKSEIDTLNAKKKAYENARDPLAAATKSADGAPVSVTATRTAPPTAESVAKLQSEFAAIPTFKSLPLFIDGIITANTLKVDIANSDADENGWVWRNIRLNTSVDSASDDAKSWRQILIGASHDGQRFVTVGLGDGVTTNLPRAVSKQLVSLTVYNPWELISGMLGLVFIAAAFVAAGWRNGLLRDRTPTVADPAPTFSLARVQMAWWLLITTGGFLYIWLVAGEYLGLNTPMVFTLIGISGASGLAVAAIKSNATVPDTGQSISFMRDILSDGTSIALHRIQMLAWTFILGAVFIWTTLWSLTFPAFDTNLMVLAGFANGLYIGFRAGE